MQDFKPYTGPVKLVLAFDIGTIYSAVSYCILEPHQVPKVLTVAKFPTQGGARADTKVPSVLYYDKNGNVRAAGAEVLSENIIETALNQGWTKAEWWKLHLRPEQLQSALGMVNDLPPLPPGKSAVDVLADFIKYLFECCRAYIQEHHPAVTWSSMEQSTEYVLTYPGGWEEQKCLYRRAIERARLTNIPEEQLRVHMLTEAEANLHFCASQCGEQTADQAARRGVAIIDAGGGIIDLGMFSMTFDPISYEEIAPAESQLQGSIFVTRRATALIQGKLRGWEHSSAENVVRFTREFDQTTKFIIESDQEPVYIRVAGRRMNSSKYCVSSGQLKLSGEEATRLFDESIGAITSAFQSQQKSTSMTITAVFLVGGLSTNDWVWSRLQSYFVARKISLHRQDTYVNKVVAKGAVISRVIQEIELGVAHVTRSEDCTLSIKDADNERIRWKAVLRDCIRRGFTRMLLFARRWTIQEWFPWTETNATGLGVRIAFPSNPQDSLFVSKRVNLDQYKSSMATSSPTGCGICDDVSGCVTDAEKGSGIKKLGCEEKSCLAHCSPYSVAHADCTEETVNTSIRVIDGDLINHGRHDSSAWACRGIKDGEEEKRPLSNGLTQHASNSDIRDQQKTEVAEETYDAIIVGGGFGGIYQLIHLRELGMTCKLIEAESDLGGTWYWNTYPDACGDGDIATYKFPHLDFRKGWTSGWTDVEAYLAYVDNKHKLRKDCRFGARVKKAHWDDQLHMWHVMSDGKDGAYKVAARHLVMCTGFVSKPFIPELKGLDTFQGRWSHTALWPKKGIETNSKRVGVIGTGASGAQVIQEIGRHVTHLTVFKWTPNFVAPMAQYRVSNQDQDHLPVYEGIYKKRPTSCRSRIPSAIMADGEEDNEVLFRDREGCLVANDKESKDAAYGFWRCTISEKIKDPRKRALLASAVPPHPFSCKCSVLEQYFYEALDQENIDIVDADGTPILEITPKGVKTKEKEYEFDVIILATDFTPQACPFVDIDIRGMKGETIQEHWRNGVTSYLGIAIDNFPNLFMAHGPHCPMFVSAPPRIEVQGAWIVQTIEYLRRHSVTKFTPTMQATATFEEHIDPLYDASLCPLANFWDSRSSVPGTNRVRCFHHGGLAVYKREIMKEIEYGYPGFWKEAL